MGWFLYQFFRALFTLIFRVVFQTRITGRERIPRQGGLLLVSNHISFADPPLLGVTTSRRVDFLAMAELFRRPFLARLLRSIGTFPVDRARVDHAAAREAIRRLRDGRCVAIFPEAGIRLDQNSVLGGNPQLRTGVETLALLGQAVVLPVIIRDARKPYDWRNWLRRETIRVTYGQPFCLWKGAHAFSRESYFQVVREQLLKTVELT
jgi:1-acyl-sn-glycerol-3-phosphate acyltransferase